MIDKPPSIPQHPKPKSKGKKPAPAKFQIADDIEGLDVFKVLLSSDSGAASSGGSGASYEEMIELLNKSKLSKLERQILALRKKILKKDKKKKEKELLCDQAIDAISKRFHQSTLVEAERELRIHKKLEKMKLKGVKCSKTGKVEKVLYKEKWIAVRTFIQKYLSDEFKEVKSLIEEGAIIKQRQQYGATAFIKQCIADYLNS